MNSRERELLVKQEGDPNYKKLPSSARSSHKNPRIVRVSGSFGGKDRHSKVCTVRGLRDRRIRLSVPTAIQLYDLQDKLGLSQPSKVVDWLLDASKNDIDNLPPLPIIPGAFRTHFQESPNPQTIQSKPNFGMMKQGEEGPLGNASQSSHSTMPYNPYFQWDIRHPNLSLSHLGGASTLPNQEDDQSSFHLYFPYYITPSMENLQQNPLSSTLLNPSSPMKLRESGVI